MAALKIRPDWHLMQPQVRAALIAAGFLILTYSPLSLSAEASSGGQRTTSADAPSGGPRTTAADVPAEPLTLRSATLDAAPTASATSDESERAAPALQAPPTATVPPPLRPPIVMDLTTAPTSLWQRIRTGFGLPDMTSPLVTEQEEWFSKRPDYIARTVQRSSRYL